MRGIAFQWFTSYLSNRKQYVYYNNYSSQYLDISSGIPQGSILGPIMFLLYVNDLVNVSDLFPILFADDTNLFLDGKNISDMTHVVNSELQKIVQWLNANKLSINIEKTKYIIFTSNKKKSGNISENVLINNQPVLRVNSISFLGIIIDDRLQWNQHIAHIRSKIAKGIGIICKARKFFNKNILLTLYYCFIYPYMT